jgi:uncharacterized protein YndB with AHSA1/START domain
MHATRGSDPNAMNPTTVERRSDRELVITRTFNGPARILFDAWTQPALLKRWWAPCSLDVTLLACDADARVGGTYRFVFGRDASHPMAFSGAYTEVTPYSRLVYTQIFEPMRDAGEAIVTVAFDEKRGRTRLVLRELYPSKEALDGAIASGMEDGMRETMEQLERLVESSIATRDRQFTPTTREFSPASDDLEGRVASPEGNR